MRKFWIGAIAAAALLAACTDEVGAPGSNQPPVIGVFSVSPDKDLKPGQTIALTVGATDPENEFVRYEWTASAGNLTGGAGTKAYWTLPLTPGRHNLRLVASDGHSAAAAYVTATVTPDGQAALEPVLIVRPADLPSPSPTPSTTPSPTASPTASPPTASPEPSPLPSA